MSAKLLPSALLSLSKNLTNLRSLSFETMIWEHDLSSALKALSPLKRLEELKFWRPKNPMKNFAEISATFPKMRSLVLPLQNTPFSLFFDAKRNPDAVLNVGGLENLVKNGDWFCHVMFRGNMSKIDPMSYV